VLTAALVATYVAPVTALGRVAPVESNVGVALTTLAVAVLVRPMRRWLHFAVDRRCNRNRYDAGRTVEEFRHLLRSEIALDALQSDLLRVVEQTVQPASTLRPELGQGSVELGNHRLDPRRRHTVDRPSGHWP
jgi:hypothetical protein